MVPRMSPPLRRRTMSGAELFWLSAGCDSPSAIEDGCAASARFERAAVLANARVVTRATARPRNRSREECTKARRGMPRDSSIWWLTSSDSTARDHVERSQIVPREKRMKDSRRSRGTIDRPYFGHASNLPGGTSEGVEKEIIKHRALSGQSSLNSVDCCKALGASARVTS